MGADKHEERGNWSRVCAREAATTSAGRALRCDEEGLDGDVINMSLPRSREAQHVFFLNI